MERLNWCNCQKVALLSKQEVTSHSTQHTDDDGCEHQRCPQVKVVLRLLERTLPTRHSAAPSIRALKVLDRVKLHTRIIFCAKDIYLQKAV